MQQTLGYITPARAHRSHGRIFIHAASGGIANRLAASFSKVNLCCRVVPEGCVDEPGSALKAPNIELIAQPYWANSLGALPHFLGIAVAYFKTCRSSDCILVRGTGPFVSLVYLFAFLYRRPVCHWIVGNPLAILWSASSRRGRLIDTLSFVWAWQTQLLCRIGRWLAHGSFVCNGRELAKAFHSPRTMATVSSTVEESDFFYREDTCQNPMIRILFVGYIRPEKGIEYLFEALAQVRTSCPWELEIIGSEEYPDYRRRLDSLISCHGLDGNIRWLGHLAYGPSIFSRMRAADLLVLPTLSEGTPHVLVEARANGLPIISTTVGGIPSMVEDGFDGLLVPPKRPDALADAIERLIEDGDLRRSLIRNGYTTAHSETLDHFADLIRVQLNNGESIAMDSAETTAR